MHRGGRVGYRCGNAGDSVTGSTDDADDCEKNSAKAKPGECDGGDVKNVRFGSGPSGEVCFIIGFYGDGETAAAEAGNYNVGIEALDSVGGGFGVSVRFRFGTPEPGSVFLGPLASGRDRLEGATVTLVWDDRDTLRVCVDSGETDLAVATFDVLIGVFTTDGVVYDQATGVGAS